MNENEKAARWTLRSPNYAAEPLYGMIEAVAKERGLAQTLAALPLMRDKHEGQPRRGMLGNEPYIVHPLTMARHALAMGLADDDILAALLLHDVVEDTDARLDDLPVNDRVREAVRLVSINSYPGPKDMVKPAYYAAIALDPLASLVKCIDRCNNLCCMADSFSYPKMAKYVIETETYVMPLLDVIGREDAWPAPAWLLRYQLHTALETYKRLL